MIEDKSNVAIVDYGLGNLMSVYNALVLLGIESQITSDHDKIKNASHLILPGVGAFGDGMKGLRERNIIPVLQTEVLEKKKPILGICLGMQLLASRGFEYGKHDGLDFIKGDVVKFDTSENNLRLPQIGWNNVSILGSHRITSNFGHEPIFYFVHSYHLVPEDKSVIAGTAFYGQDFAAIVEKDNIFGAQFHPEKSHIDGLQILKNFLSL